MNASPRTTIITAGALLRGDGFLLQEQPAIVVRDGFIHDIVPAVDVNAGPDAQVIDCSDQILLPGLIDSHNHLSLDSRLDRYLERMADPIPALTIRAVTTMQEDLLSGITTIRCLGDKGFLDIECRAAINSGYITGPRLVLAGKGIRSSAGHGFVGYAFDGPDMILRAVRENVSRGVDIIKFYTTGTIPLNGEIPCFLSRQEIDLIIGEARRLGRKTAVHCIGGSGFDWCLDAGVDVIEHGYFLNSRQIERLGNSRTRLVLTPSFSLSEERIKALPPHLIRPHLEASAAARSTMREIVASEIPFAVGTDGVHGRGALSAEISYLLELGASPTVALSAATLVGAQVCGLDKITGTIEKGKSADIIGVKFNPLTDMAALQNVSTVILHGKVCSQVPLQK